MAINIKRLEDITRALKISNQSGKSFHTTFIYSGNKLLKIGQNNYKKLHRRHKYGDYVSTKGTSNTYVAGLHSECDAIIRLGSNDCSDYVIYNIRIGNDEQPKISKPCANCFKLLRGVGYKAIVYYDGQTYVKEKY